jgi:hypothetical protein
MANDNQGSRTFLAIVLGGIVLALVIAAYFMYGNKADSDVRIERPAVEQVPETAPPAEQIPEPAAPPAEPAPEMPPAAAPPSEAPPPEEAPMESAPEPTPN